MYESPKVNCLNKVYEFNVCEKKILTIIRCISSKFNYIINLNACLKRKKNCITILILKQVVWQHAHRVRQTEKSH